MASLLNPANVYNIEAIDVKDGCENTDPQFKTYLAILVVITILTLFVSCISCAVIGDIRRQKDESICCLDEMDDGSDSKDDEIKSYLATISQNDPSILEAQYQEVVQKYLKQQKKAGP